MRFVLFLLWNILLSINVIAISAAEDITVRACIGKLDSNRNWSFKTESAVEVWHTERAKDLQKIATIANSTRKDKNTNFAMFRVQMVLENGKQFTLFDCSNDTVFASGGDTAFLGELKIGKKIVCAADYWHPFPDRPQDSDLRKNIAEIMGLREALTSAEKDSIADAFKTRISGEDYLEEVRLKRTAVSKLVESCKSSFSWRVFDEQSNELAHKLQLIDKTQKGESNWHLNDLFGSAFQLNFADSEQAIRQFFCSLNQRKGTWEMSEPFLKFDNGSFLIEIEKYKKEYTSKKKENTELAELAAKLDEDIIREIAKSGVQFRFEIASYYDMCRNCQATFHNEFLNMGIIQQKCMLSMVSVHAMDENVSWYINGRLYQYGLAKKMDPLVSLYVSSQKAYATKGDK